MKAEQKKKRGRERGMGIIDKQKIILLQNEIFCKNKIPLNILLSLYNHRSYRHIFFSNLCDDAKVGKTKGRIYIRELGRKGLLQIDNFHISIAKISLTEKGSIVAKSLFQIQQSLKA